MRAACLKCSLDLYSLSKQSIVSDGGRRTAGVRLQTSVLARLCCMQRSVDIIYIGRMTLRAHVVRELRPQRQRVAVGQL